MQLKKYIRRLNNTDLGLSGKNGSEIILDKFGKELFSDISKDQEINFINIHDLESFKLKKKHETSEKFTSKSLSKFFEYNNLQEGDFVELFVLLNESKTYFINFLHDKKLVFTKTINGDFESNTNIKLEDFLKDSSKKTIGECSISKSELRKKRLDAQIETQFYDIKIDNFDIDTLNSKSKIVIDTVNKKYEIREEEEKTVFELEIDNINSLIDTNINDITFQSFITKIEQKDSVQMDKKWDNIEFIIGQPNTGKSYNFEESRLFDLTQKDHYKYIKIPVSGGIGNEYKGLQNTDLAITYDTIKKGVRFGEFLQVLMSAIVNPKVPHVVFLDDFHNQDISSLLSEYTPLFKSQQKVEIKTISNNMIFKRNFENIDIFIKTWNIFIENHCSKDINNREVSIVPITNRISGDSLKLIYPNNFYLLGAANFNENTLNIFADWEDRANISFKDPIETFFLKLNLKESKLELSEDFKDIDKYKNILDPNTQEFIKCCIELNIKLKNILKDKMRQIFDFEKYCFGMWKIVDSSGNAISDLDEQKKVVKFLLGMIKNALRFNNKNSWINKIGWELFVDMQTNEWFKNNIKMLNGNIQNIDYEILHEFNIYEDEI